MDILNNVPVYCGRRRPARPVIYPYFMRWSPRQDTGSSWRQNAAFMLGLHNYLGLTTNPEVMEAGSGAIEHSAPACSGSGS